MATPVECVLPQLHFDNTLGAAFIGNILAAVLYGITNLQTYIYFDRFKDGSWLKSLVLFLWLLDSLHLGLTTHTIYYYAVSHFLDPSVLTRVTWSIMAVVTITGISDLVVRGIYSYRLWRVSRGKIWLMLAIAIPSLLVFGCSIAFTVRGAIIGTYAGFSQISWILYCAFGAGVAADVIIAASLSILLWQRRTGFRRTDSMVRVLMVYSINTGAFTSVCAMAVLITYATMPNNFVFISFYFMLPKLFLNSLLATLNAREKLRENGSGPDGVVSIPLTTDLSTPMRTLKTDLSRRTSDQMLEVQVETSTSRKTDPMSHRPGPQGAFPAMYGSHSWQEQSHLASSASGDGSVHAI